MLEERKSKNKKWLSNANSFTLFKKRINNYLLLTKYSFKIGFLKKQA